MRTQKGKRVRVVAPPLFLIAIGFFIICAILTAVGVSNNYNLQLAYGQDQSLEVMWEGKEFDMQVNSTAVVQSVDAEPSSLRINLFNVTQEGEIEMKIPMDLAKSIFYPQITPADYGSFAIFVDAEIPENYGVIAPSCDSLFVKIDFATGSEQIELAVISLPSNVGGSASAQQSGMPVTQTLVLPEGEFQLDLNTDALRCDLSLTKADKRLHVDIAGGTAKAGYFQIAVPHEILGGNFTVMVDNVRPSNFTSTTLDGSTIVSVMYPSGARAIDIVGTTVIPDFPLPVLAVAAAMGGAILFRRLKFR